MALFILFKPFRPDLQNKADALHRFLLSGGMLRINHHRSGSHAPWFCHCDRWPTRQWHSRSLAGESAGWSACCEHKNRPACTEVRGHSLSLKTRFDTSSVIEEPVLEETWSIPLLRSLGQFHSPAPGGSI